MVEKLPLADLHIHSRNSFDAVPSINEIITNAQNNNVQWVSITDHNNFGAVKELYYKRDENFALPYISIAGLNLLSGVEVTCRVSDVENNKGNSTKVHLLVYGFNLDRHTPLYKLMKIKHANDRDYDFGILEYILSRIPHHNVTGKDIRKYIEDKIYKGKGYNEFGRNDIERFLQKQGITIATSYRRLEELMTEAPRYQRLNIEAKDLIKIAHASGGYVMLAHPSVNLCRTPYPVELIRHLVSNGIDGFETFYPAASEYAVDIINEAMDSLDVHKPLFFTGGSDSHDFMRGNSLGYFNRNFPITLNYVEHFLDEMNELMKVRQEGMLHFRDYNQVSHDEAERLLDKYFDKSREIKDIAIKNGFVSPSALVPSSLIENLEKNSDRGDYPHLIN